MLERGAAMPQDISFYLPFQGSINPGAGRARIHHLDWVRRHGLVVGEAALRRYQGWQVTDLAAYAYPEAAGGDLDLVTDAVCIGFPLDDLFDGPLGRQPERVAQLVTELAAIPYRAPGTPPALDAPIARAYADVWRRSVVGMSPAWRARAAANLGRFFRAYVREARNRAQGVVLDEEAYVRLRRQAVGTAPCFDLIERAGHFEVPAGVFWSHEVRLLTRCAGDVVFLCNDVHSAEREEAQGDPHNLVLIRQRARGCPRDEAVRQVTRLATSRARVFAALAARLPELCERLGVDARGQADVDRYVAGLRNWMVGNQRWGVVTPRYGAAPQPTEPPRPATPAPTGGP